MSNRSLKKEIGNKGQIIRKFSATLNNTNNLLLRDCPFKDLTKDRKKCQQFDHFKKTARSEVSGENCTINSPSSKGTYHTSSADTCVIVGELITKGLVRIV